MLFGYDSGDTEIFAIDQDSTTGNVFIAGITTAKELLVSGDSKSVFIALYDGFKYLYIKVINNVRIDTVEYMSAMGNSSSYLVLYATRSSDPYTPLIFTISKLDG